MNIEQRITKIKERLELLRQEYKLSGVERKKEIEIIGKNLNSQLNVFESIIRHRKTGKTDT